MGKRKARKNYDILADGSVYLRPVDGGAVCTHKDFISSVTKDKGGPGVHEVVDVDRHFVEMDYEAFVKELGPIARTSVIMPAPVSHIGDIEDLIDALSDFRGR